MVLAKVGARFLHAHMAQQHSSQFDEGRWSGFYEELVKLLEEAERHYGVANKQYTEYILERLEFSIHSCRLLGETMDRMRCYDHIRLISAGCSRTWELSSVNGKNTSIC